MYEAIKEVKTDDEIVLLKDLKEVVGVTKSDVKFTINLNKHAINTTRVDRYDIVQLEGNNLGVTIKNGKLINSGKDAYGIYAYAPKGGSYENLNLVLDGVTIDTRDQPIGVQGVNKNQNVTVRNCFIKTNTTAIYFPPVRGTLKVENTQIEAVNNGIVAKGGNVVISGDTKITVTGEPEKSDKPYDGDPTGKGFPKTGNAVYVEGSYKNGNAEERPITVKILDGTLSARMAMLLL